MEMLSNYSKLVIVVMTITTLSASFLKGAASESRVSLDGCQDKCGNVSIPYPFGIGDKCSYSYVFNITCNATDPRVIPTPIYGRSIEILNISLDRSQLRLAHFVARKCFNSKGELLPNSTQPWINMGKTVTFSSKDNILVTTGCDTYAWFRGNRSHDRAFSTGCMSMCNSQDEVTDDGACSGGGCCETLIPDDLYYLRITVKSFSNYTETDKQFTPCSSAFVVASDSFSFSLKNLTMNPDQMPETLPAVFDWRIGYETCAVAKSKGTCLCCNSNSTTCHDTKRGGYLCRCSPGYIGNP